MEEKNKVLTFQEREELCQAAFDEMGPYWHACTPGEDMDIIFTTVRDFKLGVNLIGICAEAFLSKVKILTFILMSNHVHLILSGEKTDCEEFFKMFSMRLRKVLLLENRILNLSKFIPSFYPIVELNSLRNEIIYVNRNAYVVNSIYNPYTYPWGTGFLFFNRMIAHFNLMEYNSLTIRDKRKLCHSNQVKLSDRIKLMDDYMFVGSYCHVDDAEKFFRDSRHYFICLTKNYEAYSEVAKAIGERTVLNDEEIYYAVSHICYNKFNVRYPSLLSPQNKMEIARLMHSDYLASNKQISRVLKMPISSVDALFPFKNKKSIF